MREAAAVALEFIESAEMRTHLEKEGDALSTRTWLGVVAGAPAALKKKLAALERIARAQREPEARRLARAYRQAAAQALAALTGPQEPGTIFQLLQMSAAEGLN